MKENDVIIDHIGITVADFDRSKAFYDQALAPIAVVAMMEFPMPGGQTVVGYGKGKPIFWVSGGGRMTPHVHVAFTVGTRAEVDAFYAAAMSAGGADNGPPGLREHYHANYYGAFVFDPDGHNIEAVCHSAA